MNPFISPVHFVPGTPWIFRTAGNLSGVAEHTVKLINANDSDQLRAFLEGQGIAWSRANIRALVTGYTLFSPEAITRIKMDLLAAVGTKAPETTTPRLSPASQLALGEPVHYFFGWPWETQAQHFAFERAIAGIPTKIIKELRGFASSPIHGFFSHYFYREFEREDTVADPSLRRSYMVYLSLGHMERQEDRTIIGFAHLLNDLYKVFDSHGRPDIYYDFYRGIVWRLREAFLDKAYGPLARFMRGPMQFDVANAYLQVELGKDFGEGEAFIAQLAALPAQDIEKLYVRLHQDEGAVDLPFFALVNALHSARQAQAKPNQ